MAEERAYDWNDEIEKDSDFVTLPAGDYSFIVTEIERQQYDGGEKLPPCKMVIAKLLVDGGTLGQTTVLHRMYLHSKCEGMLCAFFKGIGHRKEGERLRMNWDNVAGCAGRAKIGVRTYDGKEFNEVKKFLDPQGSKQAVAGGKLDDW